MSQNASKLAAYEENASKLAACDVGGCKLTERFRTILNRTA